MAAKTRTAIPWNSTLILMSLLLCFLLKFPFFAIAITPTMTISKAKSIDIIRIIGSMPLVLMANNYQILHKSLIIK